MVQVRYFDAFPKEESGRALPRMSPSTVAFFVMTLIILWLEMTSFMGAHQDYQFSVDKGVSDTFQVNLDITVATPCLQLEVGIVDVSGDHMMIGRMLDFRSLRGGDDEYSGALAIGSGWASTFGYHVFGPEEEWCRMSGIINTNRVKGQIFIHAAQWGGRYQTAAAVNMSHGINELSFGPYYPSLQNPLDETAVLAETPNSYHYYDLNIVPTTVKGFGAEMVTNQYSVAEISTRKRILPGIYFEYDFEAIAVVLIDGRMSFFQWLFRVANIVGGIRFAVSWYLRRRSDANVNEDAEEMDEKV